MEACEASRDYAIRGGEEGKVRLDLLARVLMPATVQLLDRVGLGRGMRCLDAGCGSGHVALLMGNLVGREGRVIGTDTDPEILALARKEAETANVTNIEFLQVDACTSLWQQEFDLVHARFLVSHLRDPHICVRAMAKACRPAGVIVIEDTDFCGSFCYPTFAAYERYKELYQAVVERRGGDSNIGPKLPAMLRSVGIKAVELNVIQPTHLRGEGKLMAPMTMSRISAALIAEGMATKNEVDEIMNELNKAAADSETVMSLPRIFQVWGKLS